MQVELKKRQRKNLERLGRYLMRKKPDKKLGFDMEVFTTDEGNDYAYSNRLCKILKSCNTAACACGHGPYAGIHKGKNEDWFVYAERQYTGESSALFDFLFGNHWDKVDNTPKGAALRIKYFLLHGIPDEMLVPTNYDSYLRTPVKADKKIYFNKRLLKESWPKS